MKKNKTLQHLHETMTSLYFETFQCALFSFCYMFTFLECNTTKNINIRLFTATVPKMFPVEKQTLTSFMRGDTDCVDTDWLIGQLGSRLDFAQNDPELDNA